MSALQSYEGARKGAPLHNSKIDMEIVTKVEQLFAELDAKIARFTDASGLRCVDGCGECCNKKDIEATVLEFLPLAAHLWKNGKALSVLEKLENEYVSDTCVFFLNDRCSVYPFRGLICRLFGFSFVTGKDGKKKLSTCVIIKEKSPGQVEEAGSLADGGFEVPVMTDFSSRLIGIDPEMGRRFLPINRAIRGAIEKLGLSLWVTEH